MQVFNKFYFQHQIIHYYKLISLLKTKFQPWISISHCMLNLAGELCGMNFCSSGDIPLIMISDGLFCPRNNDVIIAKNR